VVFFFIDTPPTQIYTLSLHDALPILQQKVMENQTVTIAESCLGRRPVSTLVRLPKTREYGGTVLIWHFVVPFHHCPWRTPRAVWGCVGKVRASYLGSAVCAL